MPTTFDIMSPGIIPPEQLAQNYNQPTMQPQFAMNPPTISQPEVTIDTSSFSFTTIPDDNTSDKMSINIGGPSPDVGLAPKKRGRPKKEILDANEDK